MQRLEFTIEPFVEGRPGRHVTAAIESAEALGVTVDVGPFGSGCDVSTEQLPDVVAAVTAAAVANGATHVNLDVTVDTPTDVPADVTADRAADAAGADGTLP